MSRKLIASVSIFVARAATAALAIATVFADGWPTLSEGLNHWGTPPFSPALGERVGTRG